jgi:hypothetical protein
MMGWFGFAAAHGGALAMVAAIAFAESASVPVARSQDLPPGNNAPAANPKPENPIPLPGWIADHSDGWAKERLAYRQKCRTDEVKDELNYLSNLDTYDHQLIKMTQNYMTDGETKRDGLVMTSKLRNDIATIDILAARLQALPACAAAEASPALAGADSTRPTANAATPNTVATTGGEAPPSAVMPNSPRRIVVRFDDRLPALTPLGRRAVEEVVAAVNKGEDVQLAIVGCEAEDIRLPGSVCYRRLASLIALLADRGVRNPKRLLADYH